ESRPIAFFNHDKAPVDAVLLVDNSASATASLEILRRAAKEFVRRLRAEDSLTLSLFADHPQTIADWSRDGAASVKAIKSARPGGSTAIYRSLRSVVETRFRDRPDDHRRIVVVLTDGMDNFSNARDAWKQAAESALRNEVSVYVISTADTLERTLVEVIEQTSISAPKRAELRALKRKIDESRVSATALATATGGRALFPENAADI